MNKYELMVIINPDVGSDAIKKRLDKIKKLITSQKGEVVFEDIWGARDLAYTIKEHDTGYYTVFNFTFEGESLDEIDTTLRLENEVLRHMIIKLPSVYKPKTLSELEKEEEKPKVESEVKDEGSKVSDEFLKKSEKKPVLPKKPQPALVKETRKKRPEVTEEEGPSLEDVDEKLKNIIDNPDLNF
jgi:small subunit ribosomal protein S6